MGANDELISFKDEGEQEEKISENSSAERDLADVKSSLVNESETNQNSSSDSEVRIPPSAPQHTCLSSQSTMGFPGRRERGGGRKEGQKNVIIMAGGGGRGRKSNWRFCCELCNFVSCLLISATNYSAATFLLACLLSSGIKFLPRLSSNLCFLLLFFLPATKSCWWLSCSQAERRPPPRSESFRDKSRESLEEGKLLLLLNSSFKPSPNSPLFSPEVGKEKLPTDRLEMGPNPGILFLTAIFLPSILSSLSSFPPPC